MEKHIRYNTLAANANLSPDLRMTLAPYRSLRQACKAEGVANDTLLAKLIKGSDFRGWRATGARIAKHFGLLPQDAFPKYDWTDDRLVVPERTDRLTRYDERTCVASVLVTLTDREAEIIRLYFGLTGDPLTLDEIAARLKVTRDCIRQIRNRALRRLRHPSRLKLLEELR